MSKVRATQKYFRVLTPFAGREARLYLVLPSDLPAMPVLPTELFEPSLSDYVCGTLIDEKEHGPDHGSVPGRPLPIESVRLRKRILLEARFSPPTLQRTDLPGLRKVLRSSDGFDPDYPPTLGEFRRVLFRHDLFTGRGEALLKWLDLPFTITSCATMLARAFPRHAGASRLWLSQIWEGSQRNHTRATARRMRRSLTEVRDSGRDESFVAGWRAATGGGEGYTLAEASTAVPTPEEILLRRERLTEIASALGALTYRNGRVVAMTHGLAGMPELPMALVALLEGAERKPMASIIKRASAKLAGAIRIRALRQSVPQQPEYPVASRAALTVDKLFRPLRGRRAANVDEPAFYATRSWWALNPPLPFDQLFSRMTRCLENAGAGSERLNTVPQATDHLSSGTRYRHLEWGGREYRLHVYAIDGRSNDPGVGELGVPMLFAHLVLGDPRRRRCPELCLLGVNGTFQGISIEDDNDGRLARAWRGF